MKGFVDPELADTRVAEDRGGATALQQTKVSDGAHDPLSVAALFDRVPRTIAELEFRRFQGLIYRESGIWLSESKTALLVGRLGKRLRDQGLRSFKEYYRRVMESPEERLQMLDAISTNETHFFREAGHFELLEKFIFPEWAKEAAYRRRSRRIRVWSAGCSTGQEAYSLAMALLDHFPPNRGWDIEITATDLSTRTLAIAEQGIWPLDAAREIPAPYLKKFMLKGIREQAGKMKAGAEIQSLIRFFRLNLNDASYPFQSKFDLIFCRNVLIYFDLQSRSRIVHHMLDYLSPQGYIFVGHAESLQALSGRLRNVTPTVYRLAAKSGEERNAAI